jgi:hypothetical protein
MCPQREALLGASTPGLANRATEGGIGHEALNLDRERLRVVRIRKQARASVVDDLRHSASANADHRPVRRHPFNDNSSE